MLCRIPPVPVPVDLALDPFVSQQGPMPQFTIKTEHLHISNLPKIVHVDPGEYQKLIKLKEIYLHDDAAKYRFAAYPYEGVANNIFMNRCGLKLANLDKIFNLTGHLTGSVQKRDPGTFILADIAGGPGGFTQYIQYRRSRSVVFGITYKKVIDWNMEGIDATRFIPIYGRNMNSEGDIYAEWEFYIETVMRQVSQGVDLCVADGGFEVEGEGKNQAQEFLSSRLIFTEVMMGILCTKEGSPFVFKVYDTVTEISASIIFLCTLFFTEVHIFKPIMSRPRNAERYVICLVKRVSPQHNKVIDMMRKCLSEYTSEQYLSRIFDKDISEISPQFTAWLRLKNIESVQRQQQAATNVIKMVNGIHVDMPRVNLHQLHIVLDLPMETWQKPR